MDTNSNFAMFACRGPVSHVPRIGPALPLPGRPGLPVRSVNGQGPDAGGDVALVVDDALDETSHNPVGNAPVAKAVAALSGGKADKSELTDEVARATGAEEALANGLAGAFTAATYDSATKKIVFTKQGGGAAEVDATDFIKDGMVSSVHIGTGADAGKLVIVFNTDAQKETVKIPLTDIFNPANYYDANTADGKFVAKETGKGLSTNDYTTTEKEKLSGVEAGAKDNMVEAASASAFPQTGATGKIYVAKDENKTYRWSGTQYVQIGGSSIDIVAPSTTPADAGKAADAKATGDALALRPTKAQLDAGWWSEWTVLRNGVDVTSQIQQPTYDTTESAWDVLYSSLASDNLMRYIDAPQDSAALTWEATGEEGDTVVYAATRRRIAAPVPTKPEDIGAASVADATLTPVYSQTPTFSEWNFVGIPDGNTICAFGFDEGLWEIRLNPNGEYDFVSGAANATSLVFDFSATDENIFQGIVTATRVRTDIVGYILGSQTTKPLQPQGDYQPAGNYASPSDIGIPAFSTTSTYVYGNLVVRNNAIWECQEPLTGPGVWNDEYWSKLFDLGTGAPASGGTKLVTNGQVHMALQGKADSAALAPAYSATAAYSVGDAVTHEGRRYVCNTAIAAGGEAWTAAHWTEESVQTAIENIDVSSQVAGKLNSTSAAPAFSSSATYAVGDHVTYNGVLYVCAVAKSTASATTPDNDIYNATSAPTNHWKATDMTSPDATLDIMADGALRVVAADGTQLWRQGYDLASESAATLLGNHVNYYAFAATTAAAFNDATAYAVDDRVAYNGKVYKFTAAHSAGAWDSSVVVEDPDTQALALPTAAAGKVGDFGLDVDNSANAVETMVTLTGLDNAFSVVVPKGENLADMLTFEPGELAELYFTLTAFRVNNLPTWSVAKRVVENGGAQS